MAERKTHKQVIDGWYPYTPEECRTYADRGYWENLTLTDLLERNAANVPDKLAFSDGMIELTWKQTLLRARRMGLHFLRLGIEYGDFVVLSTPNTIHAMDLVFGLNMIGAVPVMCLPRHRSLEIGHHINLHKAKGVAMPVGQKFDYVGMVEDLKADYPHLTVLLTAGDEAPEGWTAVGELANTEIEHEFPPIISIGSDLLPMIYWHLISPAAPLVYQRESREPTMIKFCSGTTTAATLPFQTIQLHWSASRYCIMLPWSCSMVPPYTEGQPPSFARLPRSTRYSNSLKNIELPTI